MYKKRNYLISICRSIKQVRKVVCRVDTNFKLAWYVAWDRTRAQQAKQVEELPHRSGRP